MNNSKSQRIQVILNERRYEKLKEYMDREQVDNFSYACAELIEFALNIKARASEDASRTNREILELILEKIHFVEDVGVQTFIHAHRYPESISNDKADIVRSQKQKINAKSFSKFKSYMSFDEEA